MWNAQVTLNHSSIQTCCCYCWSPRAQHSASVPLWDDVRWIWKKYEGRVCDNPWQNYWPGPLSVCPSDGPSVYKPGHLSIYLNDISANSLFKNGTKDNSRGVAVHEQQTWLPTHSLLFIPWASQTRSALGRFMTTALYLGLSRVLVFSRASWKFVLATWWQDGQGSVAPARLQNKSVQPPQRSESTQSIFYKGLLVRSGGCRAFKNAAVCFWFACFSCLAVLFKLSLSEHQNDIKQCPIIVHIFANYLRWLLEAVFIMFMSLMSPLCSGTLSGVGCTSWV